MPIDNISRPYQIYFDQNKEKRSYLDNLHDSSVQEKKFILFNLKVKMLNLQPI